MTKKIVLLGAGIYLLSNWPSSAEEAHPIPTGISLTVYQENLALVKDSRIMNLAPGIQEIEFTDIPRLIDPTSVNLRCVSAREECRLLEQNYRYDLKDIDTLLQRAIGEELEITTKDGFTCKGQLIHLDRGNILLRERKKEGAINLLSRGNIQTVRFPRLPEDFIIQPTLFWKLENHVLPGRVFEISYLTEGLKWSCDYTALLKTENIVDLDGWITLENSSGLSYEKAALRLIAGDIHRAKPEPVYRVAKALAAAAPESRFAVKPLFEYYLYTLPEPVDIIDQQTKQINFIRARNLSTKRIYSYDGQKDDKKIRVNLELENTKEVGLGKPLPGGKIRLYKREEAGELQFIGEDRISHTAKNEKVRVWLGSTFDILGERVKTAHNKVSRTVYEESYKITLRNHKKEKVEIVVTEHFKPYQEWEIIKTTYDYYKKDAHTIEFLVSALPEVEVVINYTVRYRQ